MSLETAAYETLRLRREGAALSIALDRPDVLNALSPELLTELARALEAAAADDGVRAVLLTGAGRGFCAGADLRRTRLDEGIDEVLERTYHPVVRAIVGAPKPVVAAVNGVAAGAGLSLALACDLRLVSENASFALGFPGIGLVVDAGGSFFLARQVGRARALELAYSNRRVGAEEAVRIGLGETLLPGDHFEEEAWAYAKRLADGPTASFARIKEQMTAALANDFEAQLALEARLQSQAAASDDFREGVAAFHEKRPPVFRGR